MYSKQVYVNPAVQIFENISEDIESYNSENSEMSFCLNEDSVDQNGHEALNFKFV